MDKTFLLKIIPEPYLIDLATRHPPGEWYEAPPDGAAVLAMCFRSRGQILTVNGIERLNPGDCIFHSPDFTRRHSGLPGEGFCNDWVYIRGDFFESLRQELQLPYNTLIPTGNPTIFEEALRTVRQEIHHPDASSDRIIAGRITELAIAVKRASDQSGRFGSGESIRYPAFKALRDRLLRDCRADLSVAAMASEVHLSPERFAVLYRKFFGVTPYATVLEARLLTARRLLHTGTLAVKEIARHCGWEDEHYFSRLFKRKTGLTPGEFRRQQGMKKVP